MVSILERADTQFLSDLHRLGPQTVQELGHSLGVTATAVRQRLNRLQASGCVGRRQMRAPRGRPYFVYEVTPRGLKELGENYSDLALILWREIHRIPDVAIRTALTDRVREALVKRYGRTEGSVGERLKQLCGTLIEQGYDVEATGNALPILRERSCPYPDLVEHDRDICQLEQEVFERVLGAEVRLTQCHLDGHGCCEFEVRERLTTDAQELAGLPV